jgi:hypothetical protein
MATQKIAAARERRERVLRGPEQFGAGRIFPGTFAPVLVQRGGEPTLRPMRFRCRSSRIVSRLDRNLNAAHVARRDSLEGTWREEFGRHHGVIAVESMFEPVVEHRLEQRALATGQGLATVDHELRSDQAQTLFPPCIWSHWESVEKPDLCFFAIVVDTAPDDLRALGLDW